MQQVTSKVSAPKINTTYLVYTSVQAPALRLPRSISFSMVYLERWQLRLGRFQLYQHRGHRHSSVQFFSQVVAAATQSFLLRTVIAFGGQRVFKSVLPVVEKFKGIFPYPEVTVSFGRDNLKESIANALVPLGLRKESVGNCAFPRV